MFGLGATELIIIFLIVLILFGAGKLPQVGRSLGTAIQEFKSSVSGKDDSEKSSEDGNKPA